MGRFLAVRSLIALGFACAAVAGWPREPVPEAVPCNIEAAFTPGDPVDGLIMAAIGGARAQVRVQAYSFTQRGIGLALLEAKRRGVDVQLIVDRQSSETTSSRALQELVAAGVPVYLDGEHEAAHNKVIVIDGETPQALLITGSYNFTYAAQYRNAENVLIVRGNSALAQRYLRNWLRHREHSVPYGSEPGAAGKRDFP